MRDSYNSNNRTRYNRDDRPEMFDAVCSKCGDPCKVPFKPTGSKPIYCSKCFEKVDPKRDGNDRRGGRNNRRGDGRFNKRDNDRPRKQSDDFSKLKDQLGSMSAKLDKILRILTDVTQPESDESDE